MRGANLFFDNIKDTLKDENNLLVFKHLNEPTSMIDLERVFGKDVKNNVDSLKFSGLVITILRNNPTELQRYYKRTDFGEIVAKKID